MSTRAHVERYYATIFPIEFVLQLLAHADAVDSNLWAIEKREFVVTLPNAIKNTPVRVRYNTIATPDDWQRFLERFNKLLQLDVGAVFYVSPSRVGDARDLAQLHEAVARRELTFDIDLNDYPDLRHCCGAARKCCRACWPLAAAAALFLDSFLRHALGCRKIVWFFSGRRGIHCWVFDEQFAHLDNQARELLVDYIANEPARLKAGAAPAACFANVLSDVEPLFAKLIASQSLFSVAERRAVVLEPLSLPPVLVDRWIAAGVLDYDSFSSIAMLAATTSARHSDRRWYPHFELLYRCMFPRLDRKVTADASHLLKLPFSLHPDTGNVCAPLTLRQLVDFDPTSPTLHMSHWTAETARAAVERIKHMIGAAGAATSTNNK